MRQAAALGLVCALAFGSAHAQPFTVEDLLSLEDLGRTTFSPDGHWLVLDVQAPWRTASRFDLDAYTFLALGRPMLVDLTTGAPARPLLPSTPGTTYTTGAFSPDGRRLVVFRLRERRLDLGVMTLASGHVDWPDIPVDVDLSSPAARWADDNTLVILSRAPEASRALARGWTHQAASTAAWSAQAAGLASGVVIGAGRYRADNPPAPSARLLSLDVSSGQVRALATGAFVDLVLSPDRRRVALIAEADGLASGLEAPSLFKSGDRRRLVLADLVSGKVTIPCPTCDLARLPPAWSRDSRAVLVAARLDSGSAAFGYWRLGDGPSQHLAPALTAADSLGRDPRVVGGAAWIADQPIVLAREGDSARLDWWRLSARGPVKLTGGLATAPGPALATAPDGLLLMTASGATRLAADGQLTPLAPAAARLSFSAASVGGASSRVVASADGMARQIWPAIGRSGADATPADARRLDVAPDLGLSVSLIRDAHGVKSVVVRNAAGAARTVLTLNGQLAGRDAAAPIAVPHKDPAGAVRTSWLYLPSRAGAKDVPVIVAPYPGSSYPTAPMDSEPGEVALSANTQVLTSAGYAVLVPSLPLAADADPAEGLADAMLAAVNAARAQHPELSATRAALWGQSYGGWGVLMAASQTDRFKAVIATSPITDLFTFHGVMSPQALAAPDRYFALPSMYGWSETGQGRMGNPPWRDFDRYRRNSPALVTDRITAPVMLVTSDSDFTTGQSAPVFSSLFRQDKDALLVNYRGEAHVVLAPANVRDLYARALAFLSDAMGPPAGPAATKRPSQ